MRILTSFVTQNKRSYRVGGLWVGIGEKIFPKRLEGPDKKLELLRNLLLLLEQNIGSVKDLAIL